jgi:hypothetical protein
MHVLLQPKVKLIWAVCVRVRAYVCVCVCVCVRARMWDVEMNYKYM